MSNYLRGVNREERADRDRAFRQWMACVDAVLLARVGVTSADLADACYRDLFDVGSTPAEAAAEALDCDDMFGGVF